MTGSRITVLDYGMCNMLNVSRAFAHVGAEVVVTGDPKIAQAADRLVLPGVGAFRNAAAALNEQGLADPVREFVASGRPFMGICVGLQLLFDASEEFGTHEGLSILPGVVAPIERTSTDGEVLRVPHIAWKRLTPAAGHEDWQGTVLETVTSEQTFYFVHSFAAVPTDPQIRIADCEYGGHAVCAVVGKDNVIATQFHPERSGEHGLSILRNFLRI